MKPVIDPLPVYPDILISLLYLGGDPPRFHWYLYVQNPDSSSGTKIHATGMNGKWWYKQIEYSLQHDPAVAAVAIIGKLNTTIHTLDYLDAVLKEVPMLEVAHADVGREPKFTCRVWLREALRRMHDAGFIHCPDVDAMEAEMVRYGSTAAEENEGDRFKVAKLASASNSF